MGWYSKIINYLSQLSKRIRFLVKKNKKDPCGWVDCCRCKNWQVGIKNGKAWVCVKGHGYY